MSEDNAAPPVGRAGWYSRVQKFGKQAVIMEEMLRLGFWPPSQEAGEKREAALKELHTHQEALGKVRTELSSVEKQINNVTNVQALLNEIRKKRIERVRLAREQRKIDKAREKEETHKADQARRHEKPPFLGHGVSAGLRYDGGDVARLETNGLPKLETATDLAKAIGIDEGSLAWLSYHRGVATIDHYHRFTIPKRSGGTRTISSPKGRLRIAQSWVQNEILTKLNLHDAAMAFRPGRSILDNAKLHQNRAIVIRLDLKDFFPSIGFKRIKGLFESFGYNEGIASILALLTTEAPRATILLDGKRKYVTIGQRQLPQGACTSPALTNILCRKLDARLTGLAKAFNFTYTRYADDCVFSTDNGEANLGTFLAPIRKIIENEGFVVNAEKTRIMRPQNRQAVTGLVVNEQPHISREDMRKFRAFLHNYERDGAKVATEKLGKNALSYAKGYLSFIQMVSPDKAAQLKQKHTWLA